MSEENKRKVVIPGEEIVSGDGYLPGENTEKRSNGGIVALRYGLAEELNKLVKVIPLSGSYTPRRGNVVIGKVELLTGNGWVFDFGGAENGFLPLAEVPRYVNQNAMDEVFRIGDLAVLKIWNIGGRGIDFTIKSRGLGRIDDGIIFKINPNKVPRVIGKEGSMIKLIKDNTNCDITVGQNGYIWIIGDKVEDELFARKAIEYVVENSFTEGLTESFENWFEGQGIKVRKSSPTENSEENYEDEMEEENDN
jgi:exosome complex component RRP4